MIALIVVTLSIVLTIYAAIVELSDQVGNTSECSYQKRIQDIEEKAII
jgi:hypothetical protein